MKTFVMAVAAAGLVLTANTLWAQRDAGSKIRGDAYGAAFSTWSGGAYQRNAYHHARVLQQATSSGKPVPKAVATEQTDAIRHNLEAAKKHFAALRDKVKDDPTAIKLLDSIDQHHKKAIEMCGEIEAACATGEGDAVTVNNCCATAADELRAAQADYEKLMAHFKLPMPGETAKPGAKK